MNKLTKIEINCETGESLIVELTDAEVAQLELDRAASEAHRVEEQAAADAKASAKASAEAKLAALGLTPEEISAL